MYIMCNFLQFQGTTLFSLTACAESIIIFTETQWTIKPFYFPTQIYRCQNQNGGGEYSYYVLVQKTKSDQVHKVIHFFPARKSPHFV